jgi:hypothetical protein
MGCTAYDRASEEIREKILALSDQYSSVRLPFALPRYLIYVRLTQSIRYFFENLRPFVFTFVFLGRTRETERKKSLH